MGIFPHLSSFSLLIQPQPGVSHTCIDIHPTRWETPGPFDEAIFTIIAATCGTGDMQAYWTDRRQTDDTPYTHPDFTIHPGGLFVHAGRPLPEHRIVSCDPTHVILPNGQRYARTALSSVGYSPSKHAASAQHFHAMTHAPSTATVRITVHDDLHQPHHRVLLGVLVGLLESLDGVAWSAWQPSRHCPSFEHVARIVGEHVAIVHKGIPGSQKEAVRIADTYAQRTLHGLLNMWVMRPNRAWLPQAWRFDAALAATLPGIHPADRQAGYALGRSVLAHAPSLAHLGALISPTTAHESLAQQALHTALHTAVLHAYTDHLDRLKVRAASRARALLHA